MGQVFVMALWRGARAGLVIGTMYFLVIGILAFFGATLGSGTVSLLWLVLFVGTGAACGLVLGGVAGVGVGLVVAAMRTRAVRTSSSTSDARLRLAGAFAAGVPVLVLCLVADITGIPGVLTPEWTTTLLLPTVIAAWGGASAAPRLELKPAQPKRPDT